MDVVIESTPDSGEQPKTTSPAPSADSTRHMSISQRYMDGTPDETQTKKLSAIYDFAMSKCQSEDVKDVIWEVINIEGTVGTPRLGETKLDRVYRYCQLRREEAMIQKELREIHGV